MSTRKALVWRRTESGYAAESRKSAQEYVITRDNRAAPHAPRKRTYTAWTRATPRDELVEIDWTVKCARAKALCQKFEARR